MESLQIATERGMLNFLRDGQLSFPQLRVVDVEWEPILPRPKGGWPDALLTLSWYGKPIRFVVEAKRFGTPKEIRAAADQAQRYAKQLGVSPLVFVPYLSDEAANMLQAEGVSAIDLCGNLVINVPRELLIFRTGRPNRFQWESTIKNVFRRASSVVARMFLLVPKYESVTAVLEEIKRRGSDVTLATISKVCKALEEDLIVERGRGRVPTARRVRLLQPDKLLDALADNYEPPKVLRTFRGKSGLTPEVMRVRLAEWCNKPGRRVVLTGADSVSAYAVMAREPVQTFYCSDLKSLLPSLGDGLRETDRFADVSFKETADSTVYFDARPDFVASPIQTYLELANGDSRDKQTAADVRRVILDSLAQAGRRGE